MPEIKPGTPLYLLGETLRQAFTDVLSQALASSWNVDISAEDPPASNDSASLHFGLSASGGLRGNAAFELKNSDAVLLAQKLLKESPDPAAELSPERKQAVEELLGKMAGSAATACKTQFGDVVLQIGSVEAPAWRGASITLLVSEAASSAISVKIQFDSELLASAQPPTETPAANPGTTAPAKMLTTGDSNLDLLLGVDLSLTLRFGQRVLTLREILDLSSGSIIELDRQVQEPADLLLGDKLIARGEVVIVDGNYGLRITEVSDSQPASDRIGLSAGR